MNTSDITGVDPAISLPRLTRGSYTSYFTLQISNIRFLTVSPKPGLKVRGALHKQSFLLERARSQRNFGRTSASGE